MEANKQLAKLYKEQFSDLVNEIISENEKLEKSEKGTCPLLLKVPDNYLNSEMKIMVFGKETNRWYGETISDFNLTIEEYNRYNNGWLFSKGGPFFKNGISKISQSLEKKMPGKKISIIWNNIIKVGKMGRGFPNSINHITQKKFNVVRQEIDVLRPDFLIFLSGPSYDQHIRNVIGEFDLVKVNGYRANELVELKFKNISIPAFRTYHPIYLNQKRKTVEYFSTLSDKIKNEMLTKNIVHLADSAKYEDDSKKWT